MREFLEIARFYFPVAILLATVSHSIADESDNFKQTVAPILSKHCFACHSGSTPKGGLDLFTRDTFEKGGESGPLLDKQSPLEGILWEQLSSGSMPPKKPLEPSELQALKEWIQSKAKWSSDRIDPFEFSSEARAGFDWWSLQPIQVAGQLDPATAENTSAQAMPEQEGLIDWFIDKELRKKEMTRSASSDRRTLLRRLYFDLIGLPPSYQELKSFIEDNDPDAYERRVDELLASPRYGERWARHWLDVVRFGESNGFEYDEPRDHAWHYRNWLITAFNEDLPYDTFVRMQLAGDVMNSGQFDSQSAAGFLVAGPHNTTLPSNDKMRMVMAQDEIEDLVGTITQTFLGLTANCARCHDHKFDPISQKDYYSLAAAIQGVTHGEKTVQRMLHPSDAVWQDNLREELAALVEVKKRILAVARSESSIGSNLSSAESSMVSAWDFSRSHLDLVGKSQTVLYAPAKIERGELKLDGKTGYLATSPIPFELLEKTLEVWIRVDNREQQGGGALTVQTLDGALFDSIVFGEREPKKWMAGSNGFSRYQTFGGNEENSNTDEAIHFAISYQTDGTITGYRNGIRYGESYNGGSLQRFKRDEYQIVIGMRHAPAGGNRMLEARLLGCRVYNRALSAEAIKSSFDRGFRDVKSDDDYIALLEPKIRHEFQQTIQKIESIERQLEALRTKSKTTLYTCISKDPGESFVLARGDVGARLERALPRGLETIKIVESEWGLGADATDAQRRVSLANWVTNKNNSLFLRSIVNRLWHYHFGQGIVDTPNDFGFQGGRPTHPELLDELAKKLKDDGFRLKPLHRMIVLSGTYRQSSSNRPTCFAKDANNRWLWRKTPIRLEAEEVRDAMIQSSGLLSSQVGDQGYRDVRHEFYRGSHFYHPLNESPFGSYRRTLYRFSPRGGHNSFLDTFDCPDPSTVTPRRAFTNTPLQALALMNNSLVLDLSERLSKSTPSMASIPDGESPQQHFAPQVEFLFQQLYQRSPTEEEIQLSIPFIRAHGLAPFCRVLFNSNEFLYVR